MALLWETAASAFLGEFRIVILVRTFFILGSVSAFLAVALGAFAGHALKQKLPPEMSGIFEVGVRYHMYHAFALFVVAGAAAQFPNADISLPGWLFVAGTFLFSGSLYALSITGIRWLGAITPVGGICFLAGWLVLAWNIWQSP